MTVETSGIRYAYSGNGSTTAFSFPRKFRKNADLVVVLKDNTTGVETVQTITTHYTVAGAGVISGGTVTMLSAPATGTTLVIYSDPSPIQELDLVNLDNLPAENIEDSIDHTILVAQRLKDIATRAMRLPEGFTATFDTKLPALLSDNPGATIIVNEDGDGFDIGPTADEIEGAQQAALDAAAAAAASAADAAASASSASAAAASTVDAAADAAAAAASAAAAAASETAAASSATSASTSATNAETSATAAAASAAAAAASETAAASSATTAADDATSANTSKLAAEAAQAAAETAETNAAASAAAAAASVSAATGFAEYADDAAYVTANGAAEEGDVYYNTTTDKIRFYNGSAWADVGTGSGSGGINHVTNGDAETDTTGWVQYEDSPDTMPNNGEGIDTSIETTWTRSTSTPLRSTASFLLTKGAVDCQGEGVAYDFTIAAADKYKVHSIEFSYEIASGTYADNDLSLWILESPNSLPILVQPTAYQIKNVGVASKHIAHFQTGSATQYRLIIHVSSTSASAYTVKFDDFKIAPQVVVQGTPVTDWVSYTPTGSFTNTTYTGRWRRVGDSMECEVTAACTGAPTAANFSATIPSGYTIDTAKLSDGGANLSETLGYGFVYDTGTRRYPITLGYLSTTSVFGICAETAAANSLVTNANPITFASGDTVSVAFRVPISGWSSNVVMSDSADTRVVACRAYRSGSQTGVNPNGSYVKVQLNAVDGDTHAAFDTATNYRYTVKTPGWYNVEGMIYLAATNVLNAMYFAAIYKNGSIKAIGQTQSGPAAQAMNLHVGTKLYLVAGDYIELYLFGNGNNSASTLTINADYTTLAIAMSSGPAQIAASETVACRYTTAAGQSIPNSTATTVVFGTKGWDSHGAFNAATGVFTAPISGEYDVKAMLFLASNTGWAAGEAAYMQLHKNGALYSYLDYDVLESSTAMPVILRGADSMKLLAGETLSIVIIQASGGAISLNALAEVNYVSIKRSGNY